MINKVGRFCLAKRVKFVWLFQQPPPTVSLESFPEGVTFHIPPVTQNPDYLARHLCFFTLFPRMKIAVSHQSKPLSLHPVNPVQHITLLRNMCQHDVSGIHLFGFLQYYAVSSSFYERYHAVPLGTHGYAAAFG